MEASIHSHFVGISGGILMSIIAFSIVFIVIAGLMLLMMGLKCFVSSIDKASAARSAPVSAPAAPVASPAVQAQGAEDSDELLAVISAAIAAACGSSARVVRFISSETKHFSYRNFRLNNSHVPCILTHIYDLILISFKIFSFTSSRFASKSTIISKLTNCFSSST